MGCLTPARSAAYRVGYPVRLRLHNGWNSYCWARHEGLGRYARRRGAQLVADLRQAQSLLAEWGLA